MVVSVVVSSIRMSDKWLTRVCDKLIGAGSRGHTYSNYGLDFPEQFKLVAVADPNQSRNKGVSCRT